MFCSKCGTEINRRSKVCTNCGNRMKSSKVWLLVVSFLLFLTVSSLVFLAVSKPVVQNTLETIEPASAIVEVEPRSEPETPVIVRIEKPTEEKEIRQLTEIIADAQKNVFTITTAYSQGSGFLYNKEGIVVTNAHVVEGSLDVTVRTMNGTDHEGKVIGYSNEIDVAIIKVADFVGRTPSKIEVEAPSMIGEEVVALGSPLGLENTASMGYVTGVDRNFYIDNFVYSGLYQISAPISPGSSGGPLLSQKTEHIIAINSAKDTRDTGIGFSIPIYTVYPLIESWIKNPMTEEDIYALFYYSGGLYYNDFLWDFFDSGYFDGGDYADDPSDYEYWDYEYDDYWEYEEYDYHDYFYDDSDDGDEYWYDYEEAYDEEEYWYEYDEAYDEEEYWYEYDEEYGEQEYWYDDEEAYEDEEAYWYDDDEAYVEEY